MAATSRKLASSRASKCSLFLRKKLIGISIRPPDGEPKAKRTIKTPR